EAPKCPAAAAARTTTTQPARIRARATARSPRLSPQAVARATPTSAIAFLLFLLIWPVKWPQYVTVLSVPTALLSSQLIAQWRERHGQITVGRPWSTPQQRSGV